MDKSISSIHWKIYSNLKRKAYRYEQEKSSELVNYRKNYVKHSKRSFTPSTKTQLYREISRSQIIFIGDFHTFDQSIKNVIRTIKHLWTNNKNLSIGLEMVHMDHQNKIEAYLNHHLTEIEFLEEINYRYSWRFPWIHYKKIFDLAKELNLKITALNSSGTLKERDVKAAELIVRNSTKMTKMVILFGEYHILPNKLPKFVLQNASKTKKDFLKWTIIHQNMDEVFWQLKKQNKKNEIIKFSKSEYCLNTSPPWLKYESLVYWYENLNEDIDFDIHEYILEKGRKILNEDANENFYEISKHYNNIFKLKLKKEQLENFQLRDILSIQFIKNSILKNKNLFLRKFYLDLIEENESFSIIDSNLFYCSNYSMNNLSYLAGFHIYHLIHEEYIHSQFRLINKSNNKKKAIKLYISILINSHLFAYFFNKIINPNRKCNLYVDFEMEFKKAKLPKDKLFYKFILQTIKNNKIGSLIHDISNIKSFSIVANRIGNFYGEYLFKIFEIDKNKNNIIKLLKMPPDQLNFNFIQDKFGSKIFFEKKRYY